MTAIIQKGLFEKSKIR